MNIHTPERQPNETQAQYRERQRASKAAYKATQPTNRRGLPNGREQLRQSQRDNGSLVGTFGRGLMRAAARKRAEAMPKVGTLRDENGAFTVVGRDCETSTGRRMWLAGISAQRGY